MKKIRIRVKIEGTWLTLGSFPVPAESVLKKSTFRKKLGWPFAATIVLDLEIFEEQAKTP